MHCESQSQGLQAHHVDYGKPLSVMWLCKGCHGLVHRKDSQFNPNNNSQSPLGTEIENETIQVTFTVPLTNFLALNRAANELQMPISKMLRSQILKDYPIQTSQIEFDYDNTQHEEQPRVPSLEANQGSLYQQKLAPFQSIWRERNISVSGMESKLLKFHPGHGEDAEQLQRTGTS